MIQNGLSSIALDIGSTSIKGAALDLQSGQLLAVTSRPFPNPINNLPSGHIEIDPKAIIDRVLEVIEELSKPLSQRCWMWICGQMGGLILADERGRAKSNYISWQDQRTLHSTSKARPSIETIRMDWPESIFASLGRELQPGSTSTLLHWLSEHDLLSDGVLPLSIGDYCISHLAKQPGTMHATQAIGLLDLRKKDWHYQAMERIGLGDLWWPELILDNRSTAECKIGSRVYQIYGSYGDQQCALLGMGLDTRELSIHFSTRPQFSMLTESFLSGPYQTRAYLDHRWLNTLTPLHSDKSLDAMMGLLSELATPLGKKDQWKSIIVSGGPPNRSPELVQWISEQFGVPVKHGDEEETLKGLLRLASQLHH